MWKFSSENDYPNIILHDCKIIKVDIENNDLVFQFDNRGFWANSSNPHNSFGKILRTDESEVRFINCDVEGLYLFKKFRLLRKPLLISRKELSLKEFASKINNGDWKFEFIVETYAWQEAIFIGSIHSKIKPYRYECQLHLSFETMIYSWNNIYEDRPW